MSIKSFLLSGILLLAFAGSAHATGAPNFMPALYGDGEVWGTKFTATLKGPRGNNAQSFDGLFLIINGVEGQLPVAEASPGNPHYNGGRWDVYQVMWIAGEPTLLMSYDDILYQEDLGNVLVKHGTPPGGPPQYFVCPMLPVK